MPGQPRMRDHARNASLWRGAHGADTVELDADAISRAIEIDQATDGRSLTAALRALVRQSISWRGSRVTVADALAAVLIGHALDADPAQSIAAARTILDRLDGPVAQGAGDASITVTLRHAGASDLGVDAEPLWGSALPHVNVVPTPLIPTDV